GLSGTPIATTNKPLSLVDICGFPTDPVKIGQLPESKTVFEAVVAVPFIEKEGEREFFKTMSPKQGDIFDDYAGQSIKRQAELMEKYVFPPTFDFVQNISVDPIAMYIFEFSHKFTQDDLSHMWQNLSPKIGTRAEDAMATVSHPLLANHLLGFDFAEAQDAFEENRKASKIDFPENLQWMVFKVKQRAKSNYFKQIDSDETATIPFYTQNWPYDFFSLIEVAEIDAEVNLTPTQNNLDMKTQQRTAAQEALNEITSREQPLDVGPAED
ncbi:MAG TPA: hypothetical protein DF712_00210, partial [Balneola sp.]|nr:hypothetical protein [Balneola sp.]